MGVVLLWMCFLAVLGGTALAVAVVVRDGRHYLAARRAGATRLEAVAQVPVSRKVERPVATPRVSGRGLGQLIPTARVEASAAAPSTAQDRPRGRGLGQLMLEVPTSKDPFARGLGRLVSDRSV